MSQNLTNLMQPLGAGDLIDRAVRLYRQNFFTLIRIAALPVIISAIGSVFITVGWRGFYTAAAEAYFAVYFLLLMSGAALWIVGSLMTVMVMGGAARSLVRHLLWGEAVTVRETFRSVRERFWSLLGATVIVGIIVSITWAACFYGGLILVSLAVLGGILVGTASPFFGILAGTIVTLAALFFTLWLFFLIVGKFAYVPQVLLVENQGVFASIGRSASLAHKNWFKLGALVVFTTFAAYSALMVFYVPLIWYAQANGIPFYSFEPDAIPTWFAVTGQVIWQLSFILLVPIWMLGLSLMYVDERVRHEAYDVELMAARQLGEMPALHNPDVNPLRPALGRQQQLPPPDFTRRPPSNFSTLGLN